MGYGLNIVTIYSMDTRSILAIMTWNTSDYRH